jgi:predicted Fe-S protein YdhL (DUF1289 family)
MVYENVTTFEEILEITPEAAFRIPNFGARCVTLLKDIQRSQDPALHQSNQHMLLAVKDHTVQLITRLRQEIPAFNTLEDNEQVAIIMELRLRNFDAFKELALKSSANTPQRQLRSAMAYFGYEA